MSKSQSLGGRRRRSSKTQGSGRRQAAQRPGKYLSPHLANLLMTDIKPMLLKDLLDPIAREGKIETVKRLCIIVNEIMRLGVASGIIEFNPLADLTKLYPTKKVVHHPASGVCVSGGQKPQKTQQF